MRWLKWVIIGVLALVVAVVATVYILLSRYDFNDFKPQITQAAKEATGRELKLGGDIQLKIGMTPALTVEAVSFQNAPWGSRPDLAKIRRFEVQVALIPLLSGNISVKRLVLVEPDILIESDKSGNSNLTFEAAKKPETAPKEAPVKGAPAKLPALTFDQVKLEKAKLTYKDGVTGKSTVVALESLVADAPSMSGPVKLSLRGTYNEKVFDVSGTLGSILGTMDASKPWPLKLEAKAGGATVAIEGQITDLQNLKALSLVLNAQGASIPELAKLGDVKDVPDVGPFKAMVKVTGSGERPSVEALDLDLGTEDLAKVKLTGAFKDPMGKKGLDLVFSVKGKEMGNLQKLTGQASPLKGPFQISARAADAGEKAFKVSDLKVALPNMDLAGSADVNMAGPKPRIAAALTSQKMDLRPLMPAEKKGDAAATPAKPAAKKDKVFPSDPLPLEGLKAADATVQVRAKQIITSQMALDDLTLDLALKDGALNVKPLKAFVGGGSLDVSVALQPQGKEANLAIALKMSKIDIGRMAKEMQITDILEGTIDGEVDLKGRGGSVAAIMGGLNGKTVLTMGKGRLDNKYIDLVGADLAANLFRLVNPFEKEKGKSTEINCLVSRFDMKDGMAQSTALVFDTSRMSVVGDGNINLKTEGLDLSLKPSPKEGAGLPGVGKIGVNLSEVVKPFKLAGTMANPSLGIDPAQAALAVGKSVGGAVSGGPLGAAAALTGGGGTSAGDGDPCAKALEAARTGVKPAEKSATEKVTEGVTGGAKGATKGAADGVGSGLKKLFKK